MLYSRNFHEFSNKQERQKITRKECALKMSAAKTRRPENTHWQFLGLWCNVLARPRSLQIDQWIPFTSTPRHSLYSGRDIPGRLASFRPIGWGNDTMTHKFALELSVQSDFKIRGSCWCVVKPLRQNMQRATSSSVWRMHGVWVQDFSWQKLDWMFVYVHVCFAWRTLDPAWTVAA